MRTERKEYQRILGRSRFIERKKCRVCCVFVVIVEDGVDGVPFVGTEAGPVGLKSVGRG